MPDSLYAISLTSSGPSNHPRMTKSKKQPTKVQQLQQQPSGFHMASTAGAHLPGPEGLDQLSMDELVCSLFFG